MCNSQTINQFCQHICIDIQCISIEKATIITTVFEAISAPSVTYAIMSHVEWKYFGSGNEKEKKNESSLKN